MPKFSVSRDDAIRAITELERALAEGYLPREGKHGSRLRITAARVAADRLGWNHQTARQRFGTPDRKGYLVTRHGIKIDWKKYKPLPPPPEAAAAPAPLPPAPPEPPPGDPIEVRRLKDDLAQTRASLKGAERRAADAEARARDMLGLTSSPLMPQLVLPGPGDKIEGGRTVVLHLSDVHYGETVLSEEMDGLNRYDAGVSKARLGRFFSRAVDLMTTHWHGDPPDEVILCLGGDLISGNLHPELEETNAPALPVTVREVGEHIAGGILLLRREIKRPIRVYSVPGNHGRSTPKPQSKARSESSFDLLATDFAEAVTRGAHLREHDDDPHVEIPPIAFYKAQSPDCYFSTYGWHWLLTHGDAMGGKGAGTGFIGPMATIIKGHRKLIDTSWRSSKPVHFVLTAHFHTTGRTSFGWANGSVIGYSQYPRDLRADPEPSQQNMFVVHPRRGIIMWEPIYLGVPGEGSLYAGPASIVRPAWSD